MTAVEPIIPFDAYDYDFIEKLGKNALGGIYSAKERSTQKNYCIKVIYNKKLRKPARAKQVLETISSLDHKNITKIYGVTEISDKIYILLEHASFGTLSAYFKKSLGVSEQMAKDLFRQIVTAVYYLHSNKIAHCGLNPTSIMIDSNGTVKINDSGLGPLCIRHSLMERDYMAPEAIGRSNKNYDGFKADMYSLGIIFRYIVNESGAPMTPVCQTLFEKLTYEKEFLRPSTGAVLKNKWLA